MASRYDNLYKADSTADSVFIGSRMDQLMQLLRVVWDGDLISKDDRDWLVKNNFAVRAEGFNIISQDGLFVLAKLGKIRN